MNIKENDVVTEIGKGEYRVRVTTKYIESSQRYTTTIEMGSRNSGGMEIHPAEIDGLRKALKKHRKQLGDC